MASPQVVLEYLTTTKIGEKGQLTVPKQFREELGLGTGAPFAVLRLGDGLILLPEQKRFDQLCEKISSTLTGARITAKAVLATLPETRERVFKRRYGQRRDGATGQVDPVEQVGPAAPSSGPKLEERRRK